MIFCKIQLKAHLQYPKETDSPVSAYLKCSYYLLSSAYNKIMIEQVHCHSSVYELDIKSQFRQKTTTFLHGKVWFSTTHVGSITFTSKKTQMSILVLYHQEYLSQVSLRLRALKQQNIYWKCKLLCIYFMLDIDSPMLWDCTIRCCSNGVVEK